MWINAAILLLLSVPARAQGPAVEQSSNSRNAEREPEDTEETLLEPQDKEDICEGSFELGPNGELRWAFLVTPFPEYPGSGCGPIKRVVFFDENRRANKVLEYEFERSTDTSRRRSYYKGKILGPIIRSTGGNVSESGRHILIKGDQGRKLYHGSGEEVPLPGGRILGVSANGRYLADADNGIIRRGDGSRVEWGGSSFFPSTDMFADEDEKAKTVSLFDESGFKLWSKSYTGYLHALATSPSGKLAAYVHGDLSQCHLRIVDGGGRELWAMQVLPGSYPLAFSHDDRFLFSILRDGYRLFEVQTGKLLWHRTPEAVLGTDTLEIFPSTALLASDTQQIVALTVALEKDENTGRAYPENPQHEFIHSFDHEGNSVRLLRKRGPYLIRRTIGNNAGPVAQITPGGERVLYLTKKGLKAKRLK